MARGKAITYFIIFLFFILPFQIMVSGQTLPFKHYSFRDGLASSSINSITQDSSGYMWFGSYYGVSRFDGLRFRNFSVEDGLPHDNVWNMFEDTNKNLWFATLGGGICRLTSDGFRSFGQADGITAESVICFSETDDGQLLVGTSSGIFCSEGNGFRSYPAKYNLNGRYTRTIAVDKHGKIWLGGKEGLIRLDYDGEQTHYTKKHGLPEDDIHALLLDKNNSLWIGTTKGLGYLRKGVFTSFTVKDGLSHDSVTSLCRDEKGNVWIGTKKGLTRFYEGKFYRYYTRSGLPGQEIHAIYEDREGNIWFGTNLGVNRIISSNTTILTTEDGLPSNVIWSIAEDKNGRYWFGTDNGLSCYADGKFENHTTQTGLPHNRVFQLFLDSRGKLWMGTEGGLSVYSSGKFKNYSTDDGLPHPIVLTLMEDQNRTLWIGTSRGLCRLKEGKITPPNFHCERRSIRAILVDKERRLWFSDTKGLVRVSGNNITRFTTRDGLVHDFINSLSEDLRGRIWICTDGGLSYFYQGQFKNFTTADGLSSNYCYFAVEDANHNLWIGTVKGIHRITGIHKDSFAIDASMGDLVSAEISPGASLRDSSGDLWFGTVNGVTRFTPHLFLKVSHPPPVYIDYMEVFENQIPFAGNTPIHLESNQNYMKFGFVGLSFTSPTEVKYRYRLKGFDKNWAVSANRSVYYANLPPGDYSFEVTARNSQGIESIHPAVLSFKILPPFWETWWFRLPAALILFFLSVLFVWWRNKRVREKTILEERNKQLVMAQKMELLGMLAGGAVHDLKNLLTTIYNYSGMVSRISHADEKQKKAIQRIQKATVTAIQLAKQILSFTRQTSDRIRPVVLTDLANDITDILAITMPKRVSIHLESPQDSIKMRMNPTHFQQVMMNLCINAMQAMPDGGKINVLLSRDEKQAVLKVTDTGTGMDDTTRKRIFDPLYSTKENGKGTGLGLFVVKQIVELYHGEIRVNCIPGKGSNFTISFPLGQEETEG